MFYDHLPISADPPQVPCCDCLANLIIASVYNLDAEAAPGNKKEILISKSSILCYSYLTVIFIKNKFIFFL